MDLLGAAAADFRTRRLGERLLDSNERVKNLRLPGAGVEARLQLSASFSKRVERA